MYRKIFRYAITKAPRRFREGLGKVFVHTAHYSAFCGRCGSALERQSHPEWPLAAPGRHRSFHTAHYPAFCGRCGSALERQSRPEVPLAAPGLHRSVHTAHYSAFCGRCGNTREPVQGPGRKCAGYVWKWLSLRKKSRKNHVREKDTC